MQWTEARGLSWPEDREVPCGALAEQPLPAFAGALLAGGPPAVAMCIPPALRRADKPGAGIAGAIGQALLTCDHPLPTGVQVVEESGCYPGADPGEVSEKAKKRGLKELGSLGSGAPRTLCSAGPLITSKGASGASAPVLRCAAPCCPALCHLTASARPPPSCAVQETIIARFSWLTKYLMQRRQPPWASTEWGRHGRDAAEGGMPRRQRGREAAQRRMPASLVCKSVPHGCLPRASAAAPTWSALQPLPLPAHLRPAGLCDGAHWKPRLGPSGLPGRTGAVPAVSGTCSAPSAPWCVLALPGRHPTVWVAGRGRIRRACMLDPAQRSAWLCCLGA